MPKRSADERIARYLKKIEKIKKKRMDTRSSDSEPENNIGEVQMEDQDQEVLPNPEEVETVPLETNNIQPIEELVEACTVEQATLTPSEEPTLIPNEETPQNNPELDPNVLAALGEIVDDSPDFGEKIHDSLAKIWTPLLKKGMSKENRDKIVKEYLIPENCPLLKSPTLNPEILAAIPETGRFRDKKMSATQQQLGVGITAINRGLNVLLTSDKKIEAIKAISDGCRILSDLHFQKTETRKKFITPCLDKAFLQQIQIADRDETLFGNQLAEKIKASKAIATQSKHIKKSTSTPKPSTSQLGIRGTSQGNWQGPRFPLNRGGRGGFKNVSQRSQQLPPPAPQPQPRTFQARTRGIPRHPHQQS